MLLDLPDDDELVPESAVGPLVLLPELLFPAAVPPPAVPPAVPPAELAPPAVPPAELDPPADGLEVDPEELPADPDGLDEFDDADLPALDDPDWLAWLLRSVHAAKPKIVATTAAEIM